MKTIQVIEFRQMNESDYDGFAGASETAVINDSDVRVHSKKETCEAIVIIDKGVIQIDMVGEDYEACYSMDTSIDDNDCVAAMFSVFIARFGGIPTEKALKEFGFHKIN